MGSLALRGVGVWFTSRPTPVRRSIRETSSPQWLMTQWVKSKKRGEKAACVCVCVRICARVCMKGGGFAYSACKRQHKEYKGLKSRQALPLASFAGFAIYKADISVLCRIHFSWIDWELSWPCVTATPQPMLNSCCHCTYTTQIQIDSQEPSDRIVFEQTSGSHKNMACDFFSFSRQVNH